MTRIGNLLYVITKSHVYIQMHNYPDQDALSSAFGLQKLLEFYKIQSTISYYGHIDKTDTMKMIELLGIILVEDVNSGCTSEDEIILIDGQMGNINVKPMIGKVIACIDHHPIFETYTYKYKDIRSDIGACASIITSYYMEAGIKLPKDVATALIYGIKIDTYNLTRRVSNLDIDCFSYLYKCADITILDAFQVGTLKKDDLLAYQEAISNLVIENGIGYTKIGDNCSEAILGTVSDFLVHLEEVKVSVVYAHRVGGLKFSIRNEIKEVDAGKLIRYALHGIGDGGGHDQVAAGFVPQVEKENDMETIPKHVISKIYRLLEHDMDKIGI